MNTPMPGSGNTFSTTKDPVSRSANMGPYNETTGMTPMGNAWCNSTRNSLAPFARAVRKLALQRLRHAFAGQPGDGPRSESERHHRQHGACMGVPPESDRKPTCLQCEEEDQDRTDDKSRHAEKDQRERAAHPVPAVPRRTAV